MPILGAGKRRRFLCANGLCFFAATHFLAKTPGPQNALPVRTKTLFLHAVFWTGPCFTFQCSTSFTTTIQPKASQPLGPWPLPSERRSNRPPAGFSPRTISTNGERHGRNKNPVRASKAFAMLRLPESHNERAAGVQLSDCRPLTSHDCQCASPFRRFCNSCAQQSAKT